MKKHLYRKCQGAISIICALALVFVGVIASIRATSATAQEIPYSQFCSELGGTLNGQNCQISELKFDEICTNLSAETLAKAGLTTESCQSKVSQSLTPTMAAGLCTSYGGTYTNDTCSNVELPLNLVCSAIGGTGGTESCSVDDGRTVTPDTTPTETPTNPDTTTGTTTPISTTTTDSQTNTSSDATYTILDGANVTWVKNTTTGLTFRGSGELAKFLGLFIDDEVVSPNQYTLASGSTIATISPSYLNTLTAGTHTMEMEWSDGAASTSFTITDATAASSTEATPTSLVPDTGHNTAEGSSASSAEFPLVPLILSIITAWLIAMLTLRLIARPKLGRRLHR